MMIKLREPEYIQTLGLTAKPQAASEETGFRQSDYIPFLVGIFVVGGVLAIPLLFDVGEDWGYLEALPWSLASCVVMWMAVRRDGTISTRVVYAILAIAIGSCAYARRRGTSCGAGPILMTFFLVCLLFACGTLGMWVGRAIQRWQRL